jgi:hypothetical protein
LISSKQIVMESWTDNTFEDVFCGTQLVGVSHAECILSKVDSYQFPASLKLGLAIDPLPLELFILVLKCAPLAVF